MPELSATIVPFALLSVRKVPFTVAVKSPEPTVTLNRSFTIAVWSPRVVEVTSFHKDSRAWETVMEVGREYFDPDNGPAWTPVGVTGLWNPGYLHEIYALAVV